MGIVKKIKIRTNHFHFLNYSDFHFYFLHHVTKTVQIKMRATDWILMRNNHFHFLNHSDFHFYFLHYGKDGADKDASHRVDLDEDKSLSNLDEGGGFPQYNSQQHKTSQKQAICKTSM